MEKYTEILEKLNSAGKEAYLVGGCVRDLLMGIPPHDYDITTNALPEETKEIFSSHRVIETGMKHGTVTVLVDREPFEVTTYRLDGKYTDRRHPDSVEFTSDLHEDLARRDFTVNAMAFSKSGELIDPFGGKADIEKKIIRCVGDPEKRFSEDALRILRALRFSSTLGFEIEEKTAEAAFALRDTLSYVSAERCFSELSKMLVGKNVEEVLTKYWQIIAAVIPELSAMYGYDQNNPHHCFTLDIHTAKVVANVPNEAPIRFAALFHDIGKPLCESKDENGISHFYGHAEKSKELAGKALERLKSDNATKEEVIYLVAHHDSPAETDETQVLRKLRRFGEERYRKLVALRSADGMGQAKEYRRTEERKRCLEMLENVLEKESCFSLSDLAVNGDDLLNIGYKRGKSIGQMLETLLEAVLRGELENQKEILLGYAEEKLKNE